MDGEGLRLQFEVVDVKFRLVFFGREERDEGHLHQLGLQIVGKALIIRHYYQINRRGNQQRSNTGQKSESKKSFRILWLFGITSPKMKDRLKFPSLKLPLFNLFACLQAIHQFDFSAILPNRINQMVTDQQLFQLIKKAVREKRAIPHHQTQNFAQRYCNQQLAKKKLKSHHNHQKMDFIMKNFSKLETYFDLPELLNSIHQLKIKDQNQKITSTLKPDEKKGKGAGKFQLNKHFSDYKNLRFVFESQEVQGMLGDLQEENEWKSENLKNNSQYSLNSLFQRMQDEKENEVLRQQNLQIFNLLQKYKDNQREFLDKEKQENIKQTQLNSQKKKQYTNFLHKVSSYLQIVLETEHRSKWNRQIKNRSSLVHKNAHTFASIYEKKVHTKVKSPKKPTIGPKLSNTRCIEVLRQQTRKLRQSQQQSKDALPVMKPKPKYLLPSSRFNTQATFQRSTNKHSSTFWATKTPTSEQKRMDQIKTNFTFKRRSIKQKIINKLGKFIGEIDDQEHCSRKENSYYNKEINKLEVQFKHLYGRYKRETLAGEKDIEDLKQMAAQFQVKTAGRGEEGEREDMLSSQTEIVKVEA